MAVLTSAKRAEVNAQCMRENIETMSITKTQLRAAVDAIDDWVNNNAAAFNTAIPQPARTALTASQKARLLMLVAIKRFIEGS